MFAFILSVCVSVYVCVVFTEPRLAEAAASKQKTTTNRKKKSRRDGI